MGSRGAQRAGQQRRSGHILWDSVLGLEDNHESILNNLNCTEREEIRGSIFLTDNMSYQQLGGKERVEIVVQLL